MDRPRHNDQLGIVSKIGKNIKKSPLHQHSFANCIASSRHQPQPQVYNITKNDFRSIIVQQRSGGSPLSDSLTQPLLTQNPPKPETNRLQKIRPAALKQINRTRVRPPAMAQPTHNLARPQLHPLPHGSQPMMGHGDQFWSNTAESPPVSVYMRYLESSLGESGPNGYQMEPSHVYHQHPPVQGQCQPQSHSHHSPRFNGSSRDTPILPSPRLNRPPRQIYHSLPSPRFNGRGILPSPTSQYPLQSPTVYHRNLLSSRSPYPLLSPGVQYPPPLTPRSFTFSSMAQPGILGPGTFPQPHASPGLVAPSSPFGVFPISSPRWRDY